MNESNHNNSLFSFLSESPTAYHAVSCIKNNLAAAGFVELREDQGWEITRGRPYFVTREHGSIIAFVLGTEETPEHGFRMLCAHTDSPCLQVKPRPDISKSGFRQLGVELYGGLLVSPWFDRDLSLAGRVNCLTTDDRIATLLVNFASPLLTVPSIAIHLEREANTSPNINKQDHLLPVIGLETGGEQSGFTPVLSRQLEKEYPGVRLKEILSFDIFCFDPQPPSFLGPEESFIASGRLDNQLSCHAGMTAMLDIDNRKNCLLFCANHEENGSTSASGANGPFLDSVFDRIYPDPEARRIGLAHSFLISMDNAHASHPNYSGKMDGSHNISLNSGPVIKVNANQRYATNSISAAVYKAICREEGLSPQEFVMRNDLTCGSTIGPITAARLGVRTIDVGAPSLAMHSIRELTGCSDPHLLHRSVRAFLRSDLHHRIQTL